MSELILYLRYRATSKLMKVCVNVEGNNASCEEIAWLFAEKMTEQYAEYLGGLKDKKIRQDLRRYKLGQYKFVRNYLESIV